MTGHWRILWLVVGGVACLDWVAKLWLLSALFCPTCTAPSVVLTPASPPPTTERISQSGVHYGDCTSLVLAVVFFSEPCGWERRQTVASRP